LHPPRSVDWPPKQPPLCPLGVLPFEALPPAAVEPTSRLLLSRASSSREGRRAPQSVTRQQVGFRPKPTRPPNLERPVRLASSNRTGPYEVLHLTPSRPRRHHPHTSAGLTTGNAGPAVQTSGSRNCRQPEGHQPLPNLSIHTPLRTTSNRVPERSSSRRNQFAAETCPAREKCFRRNKRSRKTSHLQHEASAQSLCPALLPLRNWIGVTCTRGSKQRLTDRLRSHS